MPATIRGIAGLQDVVGTERAATPWLDLTQDQIDAFAAATGDDQWIQVDRARASQGPVRRDGGSWIFDARANVRFNPASIWPIFERRRSESLLCPADCILMPYLGLRPGDTVLPAHGSLQNPMQSPWLLGIECFLRSPPNPECLGVMIVMPSLKRRIAREK
jgi:hypothetical protein